MAYQKCPVCNGSGKITTTTNEERTCLTCNGSGIINEKTGQPPHRELDDKSVDSEIQKVMQNNLEG